MYIQTNTTLTETQLQKLSKAIENRSEVILELKKHQVGNGPHELHLTNTQLNKIKKLKNPDQGVRIKMSATQIKSQSGKGLFDAILNIGKTLLPKVLPVLGTLGLAGATGAISGLANKAVKGKQKGEGSVSTGSGIKRVGNGITRVGGKSGGMIALMATKDDVQTILKIVKQLEQSDLIPTGTNEMIMGEIQEQKGGFVGTLLASLAGPLLGSLFSQGSGVTTGKGISRAGVPTGKGVKALN